eukprot:scaffold20047_cov37-Phaeocystis_antarctica.AAC.2
MARVRVRVRIRLHHLPLQLGAAPRLGVGLGVGVGVVYTTFRYNWVPRPPLEPVTGPNPQASVAGPP